MHQILLANSLCLKTHFDYRENKRVYNKCAADNLCKTKWRQIYHDFGNRYHGPNGLAQMGRQQEGKLHLPCAKGAQGINDHKIDFLPFRAGLSWRCEIEDFSWQAQT